MRLQTSAALVCAALAFTAPVATTPAWAATELTYMIWGTPSEGEVWNSVARAFEAKHPGITVKVEVNDWDSYWQKLRVLVAGGTPPDVFAMDAPLYPDWQSRGVLLNLQPYLDADPKALDGIYPITLEAYRMPDGMYGLPRDFQTIVLYYNKDMFDAAKQPYPTADWSWDDLRRTAKALTLDKDGNGSTDQWGFWSEILDPEPWWGAVVWSYGGEIVSADRSHSLFAEGPALDAWHLIAGMAQDDRSMPTPEQLKQYGTDGFSAGIAAMTVSGHWVVPEYTERSFHWGVAPLPAGPKGRATSVNSAGVVIAKASPHPQEAWEFVKFAVGPDGQSALARLGFAVPILRPVAESPVYLDQPATTIDQRVFLDALAYARLKPSFRGYEEWGAAISEALEPVWNGDATIDDALEELVPAADDALQAKH
ncbi:MAG: sugar ABC transporter substrate-binding protein [Inquilinus limosus]|uniref:sn-glycerol-3-phosphate-binding periplasmic protein UgpB n=1 Tax=Inquilinus limosus TaxID=171674 RepID=A0A952FRT7_9PROT|nr:sugar ABC transporter substrate-binding protein [Inquilinus limosus]